ncbi:MAG: hypothetical protein A2048_06075 [Deltaproteobacteria bacterium GWA2_45_12]|nr:MAG: hypothetical protein A2048_06075 [Deltaproteobacteria bacterium GWA2_45_12]
MKILLQLVLFLSVSCSDADPSWMAFKSRFVTQDGRVLDTGNGNISHSEGQGYGMILSVHFDDPLTFNRLWKWTRKNLQTRPDALLSWKFDKKVTDPNNATDGDILVAWALILASKQWDNPSHKKRALKILGDIKKKLVISQNNHFILLPAEVGFQKENEIILNLSYYVFPALQTFAQVDPNGPWQDLIDSGMEQIKKARFGQWQLPSDWVTFNQEETMSSAQNENFGFDAIRIPLYLAWGGLLDTPLKEPFTAYWSQNPDFPATINVNTNTISDYRAPTGFECIATLIQADPDEKINWPKLDKNDDYYSSALCLLSRMAYQGAAS